MSESSRSLPDGAPLDAPPWATPPTHAGACFVVEPGDGSGRRVVPLSGASYMVGRHEGTGKIVVDHVTVSRKHALVVHEGERTFVVDASSNGTFLNGGPIPKREFVPLSQGDEVRFGDSPQVSKHLHRPPLPVTPPPCAHFPSPPCSGKQVANQGGASAVKSCRPCSMCVIIVRVQPCDPLASNVR